VTPLSLRLWRVSRRMTQRRLAEALGVTQQTISVWELGRDHHGAPVAIPDDLEARIEAVTRNEDNGRDHKTAASF
jgi:transcriptional regulator with XRE-family HTH domain